MKNILFIHSSAELYGSDRSLLNILRNINKNNYKIFVILPCYGPLFDEIKKNEDISVSIYNFAVLRRKNLSFVGIFNYFISLIKSIKFFKKFIKNNSIDLVDTNTAVVFPGAIAAKQLKVKSVWHIREIIKNKNENRFVSFFMNHYSDVIIANSRNTGSSLFVKQSKIRVVYNATDEYKDNSFDNHNQFTVGMAGRINRWKGQKLFIDAAKMVNSKYPNIKFIIAGDAYSGEEYLKSQLKEYILSINLENNVFLLGQISDMRSFYQCIDIFVLPSIQPEPFGLVIIEAMEHSVPVIATNHGGPTEIIEDNVNGLLVDYKKPDDLCSKIISLYKDESLRQRIGMNGKIKKRKFFSVSFMVKNIEEIFDSTLKNEL